MRFFIALLMVVAFLSFASLYAQESATADNSRELPATTSRPAKKLDPRLSPEHVALLKRQAQERKEFFAKQAEAAMELKAKQLEERNSLIDKHRAARKTFGEEVHSHQERAEFFKSQRADMEALVAHQKSQRHSLDAERHRDLIEFHTRQRKEREEQLGSKATAQ